MKSYAVSEDTLNEVLQYLATRPYAEVYKFLTKLQVPSVQEIKEVPVLNSSSEEKEVQSLDQ